MKCERQFFNSGKTVNEALKGSIMFLDVACKGCHVCGTTTEQEALDAEIDITALLSQGAK